MRKNRLLILCTLFLLGFLTNAHAQVQIIETVAGNGTAASAGDGAAALSAELDNPYQLALDKYGNLYIAEQSGNKIRKIDTLGIITTVAGTGVAGYSADGIAATTSKLNQPTGVAVDTAGNLYIADASNNRIRFVSASTGLISTIVGTGVAGTSPNGTIATAAKISNPRCIALDDTGNIYFSDAGNQIIRKVSISTGLINTVAGSGTLGYGGDGLVATNAMVKLDAPRGVAVDASGNIYIADMTNSRIRKVTAATGIITTIAGKGTPASYSGDGGPADSAFLSAPAGVSVDASGNVYISDAGNSRIRMVDLTGTINTIAGDSTAGFAGDGGVPDSAELKGAIAVALTSTGYYISDRTNQRIRYVQLNHAPTFVDSSTQFISMCENASTMDITPYLSIIDSDLNQTETWSAFTFPANGVLADVDVEASTGSTVTPINITYTPNTGYNGTDSFIMQVTDGFAVTYDTFYVTINSLPDPGTINGSSFLCTNTTVTFTDTAMAGGGLWAASNGSATVDPVGDVTGVTNGVDTIIYTVFNTCGADTATFVVSVDSIFVPGLSISANPGDTSCFGIAVTYVANAVNGGTSPVYSWSVNATAMATTDTFVYTPNNGDIISCTLTSNAPCLLAPGTATASDTAVVISGVVPTVNINDGAYGDTVCIFTTVPFAATSTNGGSAPTYTWIVNSIPYYVGNPFNYAPNVGDTISCLLASSQACASPDSVTSNSIIMTVNVTETPIAIITANPGDTVCTGSPVTFTASSVYGGFTPFYRWTLNGVNVATGPDYTFTPAAGDSVYCMLVSSNTCSILDSIFSDTAVIYLDTPVAPIVTITSFGGSLISVGVLDTLVAVVSNATSPSYQWKIDGVAIPGATSALFIAGDTVAITADVTCVVTNGDACHAASTSNELIITVANVGVQQVALTASDIQLLPNPNKGAFSIQGTLSATTKEVTLEVTDIIGRVVYKEIVPAQNGMIRSQVVLDNEAANGVYLMHIMADNLNQVIRFTVSR